MEEILASIRRIISDDDAAKPAPAAAKPAPEPAPAAATTVVKNSQDDIDAMLASFDAAEDDDDDQSDEAPPAKAQAPADVFELTESMHAGAVSNGVDRSADGAFDKPPEPERPRSPEAPRTMPMPDRTLLSPRTTAAVDTAFNSLAHTVLMQNSRTLEDLVREMLKPLLKAWLDDNLPNMVERLVRAEIERVSRGRG
jgi:cell pole-organizing protein PopZ